MPESIREIDPREPVAAPDAELKAFADRLSAILLEARGVGICGAFVLAGYDPFTDSSLFRMKAMGDPLAVRSLLADLQTYLAARTCIT